MMADWMDTIKSVAPTVATALGGPLAGAAVTALGSIFVMSKPTTDQIGKLFSDGMITPDHLAEIRKLEMQYQDNEKERGFKYAELAFKDTDSARQMQIAVKSSTPTILSYGVLIGGGILMGSVMYGTVKADSVMAGTIIGYVVAEMKQVLQFWFGSSNGSQEKTQLLAQADAVK
jgi:hypothetical protein